MSNRAEAALEERYKSNPRHTPSHHYYKRGFLDGYAAQSADCEAKVRQAVEATLETAIKANCKWCRDGYELDHHEATGYPYHVIESYDGDYPECQSAEIRALDPESIVQRVMKETANVTEQ